MVNLGADDAVLFGSLRMDAVEQNRTTRQEPYGLSTNLAANLLIAHSAIEVAYTADDKALVSSLDVGNAHFRGKIRHCEPSELAFRPAQSLKNFAHAVLRPSRCLANFGYP